ncbi:MAG: DMT family transporter [Oscillatoria sp. PMC 1068.18]|nr:DMT family transporter [Oscillatoria sp. PMC 1076.18]MEC4990386.1 DMT family transporter [Oscillatoria sp. PMC 1068.18]
MGLHQDSGRWRLGLGLSLVTVFLWGILPIALTITLQELDVYTLTWFRFVVAFVLLGFILAAKGQLPSAKKLKATPRWLLAIATISLAINYLLFVQGLAMTSPANAQVLIQLAPVMMGLGAIAIFRERYTFRQWMGLATLTLGFSLFFHEQLKNLINAQGTYLLGCFVVVIAAAAWAVYALAQKQLLQTLSSANIMLLIYGGCALIFTPFAQPQQLFLLPPLQWGTLIFCGLNTLVAYGAFAESLEHWEASKISALLATTPLVTIGSVWLVSWRIPGLIAANTMTILGFFGATLVVTGSAAIGQSPAPKRAIALGKKKIN